MNRKIKGFSLLELMMTMSIAAIILSVGVPGFQTVVQNNQLMTQLNSLVADINLARVEAIKRNNYVTVCRKNSESTDCILDKTGWNQGWIVFEDANRNGVVNEGEEIFRIHSKLNQPVSIRYSRTRVTFSSQGFAYGFNGTFIFSDSRGQEYSMKRVISNTGRIRVG